MRKQIFVHRYDEIISVENLLETWREFVKGKRGRPDVQAFERCLMTNLLALHECLADRSYRHSGYEAFAVSDPKPRSIHKATVSDRVLHRAIYRKLCPFFDRLFIADAFSCRVGKGTHKALDRFRAMARKASRNHTRTCWVLKCDIRKFFASISHEVLLRLLAFRIADEGVLRIIGQIISSFSSGQPGIGLPLGNLTSQLFANVYLDPFDKFVKHRLKVAHYLRYADDFALLSEDRSHLVGLLPPVRAFLRDELRLDLHPDKVFLRTFASGVDFLGWIHFPDHRVLRTATKRRMFRAVRDGMNPAAVASYRGLLRHGNGAKLGAALSAMADHD